MNDEIVIKELQKYFKELYKQGYSPTDAMTLMNSYFIKLAIKAIETIKE